MKSCEEKILAMVIKPKKVEALDRHLKLRALGFFIIFNCEKIIEIVKIRAFLQPFEVQHS